MALSGGCFQNRLLLDSLRAAAAGRRGFTMCCCTRQVPCNDGVRLGPLGQAAWCRLSQ